MHMYMQVTLKMQYLQEELRHQSVVSHYQMKRSS